MVFAAGGLRKETLHGTKRKERMAEARHQKAAMGRAQRTGSHGIILSQKQDHKELVEEPRYRTCSSVDSVREAPSLSKGGGISKATEQGSGRIFEIWAGRTFSHERLLEKKQSKKKPTRADYIGGVRCRTDEGVPAMEKNLQFFVLSTQERDERK